MYTNVTFQQTSNYNRIKKKQADFIYKKNSLRRRLLVDGELLTETRKNILSTPISELARKLRDGIFDPVDALEAYQVSLYIVLFSKHVWIKISIIPLIN